MGAITNNNNLRRLFLRLAIFAVLLASLAPSISRIAFGQTVPMPGWVEVCTAEGLQQLPTALFENAQRPVSPTPEAPDSHAGSHFEHCPFCLTHACSFGLTPVETASLPFLAAAGHYLPPHALLAPHAQFVWQPSQARAPPVFL